jgi:hypothetical protein
MQCGLLEIYFTKYNENNIMRWHARGFAHFARLPSCQQVGLSPSSPLPLLYPHLIYAGLSS